AIIMNDDVFVGTAILIMWIALLVFFLAACAPKDPMQEVRALCSEPTIYLEEREIGQDLLTEREQEILRRAKVKCSFLYRDNPCVSRFIVVNRAEQAYHVTCGPLVP